MAATARTWLAKTRGDDLDYTPRRAHEVAGRVLELCVERGVVPAIAGDEIIIRPRTYPADVEFVAHRIALVHAFITVECEPSCETFERGLELVKRAQKASVVAPGWPSIALDLLRPHCEAA